MLDGELQIPILVNILLITDFLAINRCYLNNARKQMKIVGKKAAKIMRSHQFHLKADIAILTQWNTYAQQNW